MTRKQIAKNIEQPKQWTTTKLKMYRGNLPEFCTQCGTHLQEHRIFYGKYDEETGEKVYMTIVKCPLLRWWNVHTKIMFREDGGQIILTPQSFHF